MLEKREFTLVVWEQTEEFKKFFEEAEQKRIELVKAWRERYGASPFYVGSVEPNMSKDCEPVFWINDGGPFHTGRFYGQKSKWSAEMALRNALRYGDDCWRTLTELEQLVDGNGPLLESAMRECGFRPHKRNPNQWARISNGQRGFEEREKDQKEWQRKSKEAEEQKWPAVFGEEMERLNRLWILPNEWHGLNNTFGLEVNAKGMIYVRLEVNPFSATRTEQLGWFGAMIRNRGHIIRRQNGFDLDARNIRMGEDKGIHIKATNRHDNSSAECIWPHQIPQSKIYDLADDLISRIRAVAGDAAF